MSSCHKSLKGNERKMQQQLHQEKNKTGKLSSFFYGLRFWLHQSNCEKINN